MQERTAAAECTETWMQGQTAGAESTQRLECIFVISHFFYQSTPFEFMIKDLKSFLLFSILWRLLNFNPFRPEKKKYSPILAEISPVLNECILYMEFRSAGIFEKYFCVSKIGHFI